MAEENDKDKTVPDAEPDKFELIETIAQWEAEFSKVTSPGPKKFALKLLAENPPGIETLIEDLFASPQKYAGSRFVESTGEYFNINLSHVMLNVLLDIKASDKAIDINLCHSRFLQRLTLALYAPNASILAKEAIFESDFRLATAAQSIQTLNFAFAEFGKEGMLAFGEYADFSNIEFHSVVVFNGTKFFNNAIFKDVVFKQKASFEKSIFHSWADFSTDLHDSRGTYLGFEAEANFERAKFLGGGVSADFSNRVFQAKTIFTSCQFNSPPEFQGAKLHHATEFRNAKFLDHSYNSNSYYRTLKGAMEEARNFPAEVLFHAHEMRCLKNEPWKLKKVFTRFISNLYWITANYGQSIFRPVVAFFSVNLLAFLSYLKYYYSHGKLTFWDAFFESFILLLKQFFKPVTSLNLPECISINWEIWLTTTATFQFVFSIILIALLILSLKKNFGIRG